METKRQFIGRSNLKALVFVLLITFCSSISVANEKVTSKPARYRVFSFRNISADTAKQYLTDAQICTVSKIPGSETLLVTAQTADLIKASVVLKLIDSKEHYIFEKLATGEKIADVPQNDLIAEKIGNVSIGTFANPPVIGTGDVAIIDVHNDSLVIIATSEVVEKVKQQIKKTEVVADVNTVSQAAKDSNEDAAMSDDLFDDLMNSLAEAEEKAKELGIEAQTQEEVQGVELKTQAQESFAELESASDDLEVMGELVPKTEKQQLSEQKSEPVDDEMSGMLKTVDQMLSKNKDKTETDVEPVGQQKTEKEVSPVEVAKEPIVSEEKVEPRPKADVEKKVAQAKPEVKKAKLVETEEDSPYEPDSSELADEDLTLNLPEELEIIDLLDFVGKYLGLDYMYDPELVKGKVALRIQRKIKVRELYPLIEQVLRSKGFVMTRRDNLVTIVPVDRMLDIDPEIHIDAKKVQYGDAVITRIFKLEHIDTASAKNLLENLKLGANITDIAESGTLIVTGFAYRMARIEELLEMIDQPGKAKMFKFKKLKYTMATTLAPQVKELAEQLGTMSVTISKQASTTPTTSRTRRPATRPTNRPKTPTKSTTTTQPSPTKPEIFLDADERTNRILMIGLRDQLGEVEKLIEALDVEQQDLRIMRVYDIENVGAEDVSEKLAELGITSTARQSSYSASRSRSTSRSRITKPTTARATASKSSIAATGADESPEEEPQVIIIESTNSLLVNATPDQHNKIASIIAYVDSEMREQEIPYVIYSLENQDPEDLADTLLQLIEKTTKDKEGKVQQTVKTTEDDIVIVPDKNTFSLIVYANKRNQLWIKNLIKNLDKRRPQVLINVSLVEITRDDAFNYDLQILTNMRDVVTGNIGAISGVAAAPVKAFDAGWNVGGSKQVTGFLSSDRIQVLFEAMEKKDYGRVLAQPKVLVNDNEEGKIFTSEKTFVKEETQSYPGDGTNSVTSVTYAPYEAKIELSITPNISEGDLLRLEVNMLREDFTRKAEGPPDYTTSNVETVVTVPDGSTIILGGLTKLNQSRGGSKTPLLGDVPIIGNLFRSASNSDKASNLYIFIKANILRPESTASMSQLKEISARNRAAFEKEESKFQTYEELVGIDSEPMEPLHVLETE